jgi:hypothetical protein
MGGKLGRVTIRVADDTAPPVINSQSPAENEAIQSDNLVFSANVTDTSGLKSVKFMLRNPAGEQTNWFESAVRPGTNDIYETAHLPLSQGGKWQYRTKAVDASPSKNDFTSPWVDFFVVTDPTSAVALVRQEIVDLIAATTEVKLAPKFIRLGFHDCVPDDQLNGGCDGCVDLSNADNAGLDIPIDALRPIVDTYASPAYGLSRADIWAMAALVASEVSQNDISFPMEYIGRVDCEKAHDICYKENESEQPCQENRGPRRPLPGPDMTTSQLLHWFATTFNFSAKETTAIMGAHSIGGAHRENSGFDGAAGWVNNPDRLSNGYYNMICAPPDREGAINDFEAAMFAPAWDLEFIDNSDTDFGTPDRHQWFHQKDATRDDAGEINLEKLVMLNSDIALVRDLDGYLDTSNGHVSGCQFRCLNNGCQNSELPRCPHAQQTFDFVREYEGDNLLWLNDFSAAFRKILMRGYETDDGTCADPPCFLTVPLEVNEIEAGARKLMMAKQKTNLRRG